MGTMKRKIQIGVSVLFCLLLGFDVVGKIGGNIGFPHPSPGAEFLCLQFPLFPANRFR